MSFAPPKETEIKRFFTDITPRYDKLNTILSFGIDAHWRRVAVRQCMRGDETSILDVGTGTGKFLKGFLDAGKFQNYVGLDLCESMLHEASKRLAPQTHLLSADVSTAIPFEENTFDILSAAFTLRSLSNLDAFFSEAFRVLKPRGRIVLLELTRPKNLLLRALYAPYLKAYLPGMGKAVGRSDEAYRFLSESILAFEEPRSIGLRLQEAGFSNPKILSLTGGIASLIWAEKKER